MSHMAFKFSFLISGLLLAQEVCSVDITNLLEPFYHPADAEGLFLGHLLGDYAALQASKKYL